MKSKTGRDTITLGENKFLVVHGTVERASEHLGTNTGKVTVALVVQLSNKDEGFSVCLMEPKKQSHSSGTML